MSYDEARTRNALPVPSSQFGAPGPGGTYEYFDQLALSPPVGATFATFELLYQPTSWEYIQFLDRANTGQVPRLALEGAYLRMAWSNTGMATPHVMAAATWGTPQVSAGDCAVPEGNTATTTTCSFAVTMPGPSTLPVTVDFATADGTATVANNDYVAASGTVTFPPGTTSQTVQVTVNGDATLEPYETFSLNLTNANGGVIADGQGTGTIQNDETPTASISDCTVVEGNAGNTACVMTVSLDVPTTQTPVLEYSTVDFTAVGGVDYVTSGQFLAFQPGQMSQNVTIPVIGDTLPEIDESFFVRLSLAAPPALIGDDEGVGTIVDDDALAGGVAELSHGFSLTTDLAAQAGVADRDLYLIAQQPYSSYEVVVDATSGDLGSAGPLLERRSGGGALLQASAPVGTGSGRTLRWQNSSFPTVAGESIVVSATGPGGCGALCGPDDTYRLRAWDTTYSIPRFNNSASQVTILIIENPGSSTINGHAWLWRNFTTVPVDVPFTLGPHATLVLNTGNFVAGQSGSITVTHDGGYGTLAGKTVALEPATGFSFDSPMIPRAR
jgi:hypothetical protein